MSSDVWKDRDVAGAFLGERSLHIPERQRQLEVMLRILRATSRPIRRIVDLGCGDGLLLATALEAFPDADGFALDYSPPMLEQAGARLARFDGRASTIDADLATPAWKKDLTGAFDAIISSLAIHHLTHERKRELYAEIHALLADGGVFLNIEHVASATSRVEGLFNDAMTEHLCERRLERGENVTLEQVRRDFLERPDRAANILALVEEQCRWLRAIGFRDVDCFWKYFELAAFGGWR